ncbi:MAG: hypothetical protein EA396_04285 [Anaerolineaceae bacterium]|nr:MAG: hypothetical protein EA396_04285 [Anaerolineaceae bacterium]
MAYRGLDEFIIRLEQSRQVSRVEKRLAPSSAITDLTPVQAGKAMWFDDVGGLGFPVVTNLFGTEKRMAWALGVNKLDDLAANLNALVTLDEPLSFGALIGRAGAVMTALRTAGTSANRPRDVPVQAVKRGDLSLHRLPAVRFYAGETHAGITMTQIITAGTGGQSAHTGRVVVLSDALLGIELRHPIDTARGQLPVAVVIGGDPAAMWCANVPLPPNIAPYWLAGWIRRKAVPFSRALTQPLDVPADAEIIIEGVLDMDDIRDDVTFASDSGFMIGGVRFAAMRVTAITHRRDAIFPLHVPATLSSEHRLMNKAIERLTLPILRLLLADICDISRPDIGCGRNLTIISHATGERGAVRKAIHAMWGLGSLAHTKAVIVVDRGVDVHDIGAVLSAVRCHVDWHADIIRADGLLHPHDVSGLNGATGGGFGGKIALDATTKHATESPRPAADFQPVAGVSAWRAWDGVAVVVLDDATTSAAHVHDANPDYHLIVLPAGVTWLDDARQLAWYVLACADPVRDLTVTAAGRVRLCVADKTPLLAVSDD